MPRRNPGRCQVCGVFDARWAKQTVKGKDVWHRIGRELWGFPFQPTCSRCRILDESMPEKASSDGALKIDDKEQTMDINDSARAMLLLLSGGGQLWHKLGTTECWLTNLGATQPSWQGFLELVGLGLVERTGPMDPHAPCRECYRITEAGAEAISHAS